MALSPLLVVRSRGWTQNRLAWIPSFQVVACSIFSLHRLNLLLIPCFSHEVDHTTTEQGSVLAYHMTDFKSLRLSNLLRTGLPYKNVSNLHHESSMYWFTAQELYRFGFWLYMAQCIKLHAIACTRWAGSSKTFHNSLMELHKLLKFGCYLSY